MSKLIISNFQHNKMPVGTIFIVLIFAVVIYCVCAEQICDNLPAPSQVPHLQRDNAGRLNVEYLDSDDDL
jgi:hypothetical protein